LGGKDQPKIRGLSAHEPLPAASELLGLTLGGYHVVRTVGAGAMGYVYEAVCLDTQATVALKVLKPEHAQTDMFRRRFLREAQSAVRIDHPNVVDVIDFGESEEWLYIAMEFLQGEDLSQYLARVQRLTWRQSCALLQQAASGLAAAHASGVVHRDIKPSNMLLVNDAAGGARVKIVDFGVAKLASSAASQVLTQADDLIGTVAYMSPEQCEGSEADARSDVYALGVTAYQLATGRLPFPGTDIFQVMYGHLKSDPETPSSLVPGFPADANAFIMGCLAKRPIDRYQSMAEVVAALHTTSALGNVALPPPVVGSAAIPGKPPPAGKRDEFDEARTGYFFHPVEAMQVPPPSGPAQSETVSTGPAPAADGPPPWAMDLAKSAPRGTQASAHSTMPDARPNASGSKHTTIAPAPQAPAPRAPSTQASPVQARVPQAPAPQAPRVPAPAPHVPRVPAPGSLPPQTYTPAPHTQMVAAVPVAEPVASYSAELPISPAQPAHGYTMPTPIDSAPLELGEEFDKPAGRTSPVVMALIIVAMIAGAGVLVWLTLGSA